MCGIHFTASVRLPAGNPKLDAFMKQGFITSQLRGVDGSGFFRVSHADIKDKVRYTQMRKSSANGAVFSTEQQNSVVLNGSTHANLMVGHVRAKTHGPVSNENAHPFEVVRKDGSKIIGVHNGSLTGWTMLKGARDFQVDSEWLYSKIAEDGAEAFKGFEGAFTLMWYDTKEPDVLNIARDHAGKRPLFFAWTADKDNNRTGMVGCSEPGMLAWLCERNDINLWADKKNRSIFYPEAGQLHRISLNDMSIMEKIALPKFVYADNPYKQAYQYQTAAVGDKEDDVFWDNWKNWRKPPLKVLIADVAQQLDWARGQRLGIDTGNSKSVDKKGKKEAEEYAPPKGESEVITNADLLGGMDPALLLHEKIKVGERFQFVDHIHTVKTASPEEVTLARNLGVFGMVGYVYPYNRDATHREVDGCFATSENPNQYDMDAKVRGVSSDEYDSVYSDIRTTSNLQMVVVGAIITELPNTKYTTLVLERKPPHSVAIHRKLIPPILDTSRLAAAIN